MKLKIFIIFILLFIILSVLSLNVFAADGNKYYSYCTYKEGVIEVPEQLLDSIYSSSKYNSGDFHILVIPNDLTPFKVLFIPVDSFNYCYKNGDFYTFDNTIATVDVYECSSTSIDDKMGTYNILNESIFGNALYSTFNIYTDENLSDFFLKPPLRTLTPVVQEESLQGILNQVLGILPIVMLILVGLIGLRKGLALLFRFLRQS